MNITDYKVVEGYSLNSISTIVSVSIKEGWQPYGDLVPCGLIFPNYAQAMVKYGKEPSHAPTT